MDQQLYFAFIGILSKKACGRDNDVLLLLDIFSRNNSKFIEEYSIFINDKDLISKLNENKLNLKQINERFILLSKPINTYCKINFINIQGIIDQIVKTTQPYFKSKTNNVRYKNTKYDTKKSISEKVIEKNDEVDVPYTTKNLFYLDETFNITTHPIQRN